MRQSINVQVSTQWLCPFYQLKLQSKSKKSNATYKPRKKNGIESLRENRKAMKKLQQRL